MNNNLTTSETMKTQTLTFSVPGMSCGHCESAVSTEIRKLPGVTDVVVDLVTKQVVVTGDALDAAHVVAAIDDAGYDVVGDDVA